MKRYAKNMLKIDNIELKDLIEIRNRQKKLELCQKKLK